MYAVARLLQLSGLVILPLAMFAQLNSLISLGEMLRFLVAGACLFTIGYILQQYFRGG